MPSLPINILEIPYDFRRLIRLVHDDKKSSTSGKGIISFFNRRPILRNTAIAAAALPTWPISIPVGAAYYAWKYFKKVKKAKQIILDVNKISLSNIKFPIGHPLENTVYVAHPADPVRYFPVCDFHKSLFAEKYMEAVRLLRSLGATEIKISSVSGWSKGWATSIGLKIPPSSSGIQGAAHSKNNEDLEIVGCWEFNNFDDTPSIPLDLLWYSDEPGWKEIANGRLARKLNSFELILHYTEDYGVDTKLKAMCESSGRAYPVDADTHQG